MQDNLSGIAEEMIAKVLSKASHLPASRKLEALKAIELPGILAYKQSLLAALSVVAADAIEAARKEVPKAKNVKLAEAPSESIQLAEFDDLPSKLQKKIKTQAGLLADTQIADLEKQISFQFTNSVDSTDSAALLEKDLTDSAEEYITGSAIEAGSGVTAATMVNAARKAFFEDPQVSESIEAFQFLNGDPVTPICQDLAGKIFAKDDSGADRYYPPLHWNCKSYVVPVLDLKGRDTEDLKPSKASLDEYVQLSENPTMCDCC